LTSQLKGRHDVVVPSGVGVLEDGERGNAAVVCSKVAVGCVVGDELFLKLSHREGPAMLEASYETAIQSIEQILALTVKVVFGELIHCYKYIGTFIKRQ
jgi:hypothetical protein